MSSEEVLIHVRFSPEGAVTDIGERPAAATPQGWFNQLATRFGEAYQPLSGGRGLFRIARGEVDRLKSSL
ncbi:MAG: hypothetical protein ACLP2F_10855 [Steroidobacteraceae bacterium]